MEKVYDLEERTFIFAREVRLQTKELAKSFSSQDDVRQVLRSSGSIGANYNEANGSFSKKDFQFRVKICRKEAKESTYWLRLLSETTEGVDHEVWLKLIQESIELKKIFSAILEKTKQASE